MNIVSLFDGVACARVAAEKNKIKVKNYYASEIDLPAIKTALKNWPDIKHVGGVQTFNKFNFPHVYEKKIDLLIGGSPCQDLSIAKRGRKGLDGERSKLFFEYVRILKELKPKYFVLENVASMSNESKDKITEIMGVSPILIDAGLVSAQQRRRLFWTNIPGVTLPEDKKLFLKHVVQKKVDEKYFISEETAKKIRTVQGTRDLNQKSRCLSATMWKGAQSNGMTCIRIGSIGKGGQGDRIYSIEGKSVALSAFGGGRGAKTGLYEVKGRVRKLTPTEAGRLQGLKDGYLDGHSDTQMYQMAGNAFNADVIAHIISFIPKQ